MINQMCDSLHGSIAEQFQYLVVALVLMVIVQAVKRMSRPTREQQGYDDNKVNPISM
jgi:large-conductance mechanosensitive channel